MKKNKGLQAFDEFYAKLFPNRWSSLKTALLKPVSHVARKNHFSAFPDKEILTSTCSELQKFTSCFITKDNLHSLVDSHGLKTFYLMDLASIIPVLNLDIKNNQYIADFCAAPGGKSLIIAEKMGHNSNLLVNDLSRNRINRIKQVFHEFLPEKIQTNIKITHYDAIKIGMRQKSSFDRILLDTPCSSERHLLQKPALINDWSISRTKQLAIRQYALLSSAFYALKPGGKIVYSTCSISSYENDLIIKKLLKRHPNNAFIFQPKQLNFQEVTEYGTQILPDLSGYGPIFFSVISKYKEIIK